MVTIDMDQIYNGFELEGEAKIVVVGCGGAGGNAINTMIESGMSDVTFLAINTDSQALLQNRAAMKIQIGERTRKGLGCGARPDCGFASAEEDEEKIRKAIDGYDMIFVTAGFGGGTGTGSAPVVARIAKELGILTISVVTKPFYFEGKKKQKISEQWLEELKKNTDSLITISNQKIIETAGNVSFLEGFKLADSVLMSAVSGITKTIRQAGMINIDFADVKTVLSDSGEALIGMGISTGHNKILQAVKYAAETPLIENLTLDGAGAILVNYHISPDTTTNEIDEATQYLTERAQPEAMIIFGMSYDMSLKGHAQVSLVATRFERSEEILAKVKEKQKDVVEVEPEMITEIEEKAVETPKQEKIKKKTVLNIDNYGKTISLDRKNLDVPSFLRNRKRKSSNSNSEDQK